MVPLAVMTPVLLLFVASAEADGEATTALVAAASRELGAGLEIRIERYEAVPPGDRELIARSREEGAIGSARVVWNDSTRTRAAIDVHLLAGEVAYHRVLVFEPHDALVERGRAVGLVLATVLLAGRDPRGEALPAQPPPPPAPTAGGEAAVSTSEEPTTPTNVGPPRWALEAFGEGGLALGGAGSGLGGGLAGRFHGAGKWGARLGARFRAGSVSVAQASSLAAAISLGGFRSLATLAGPQRTWDLGARAEIMLLYEALTHFSSDDPAPVHRGRVLPGAAALLEARWNLAPSAALHLAGGVETALGVTSVVVRGIEVTELAPVRLILEAGFLARF